MGRAIGRPIRVDPTTLNKEIGYYASILVEIDLSLSIPTKISVETKYCKFEQDIRISKLPKFCSHCKTVGHWVIECRLKRKEKIQGERPQVIQKQKWRYTPKIPQVQTAGGFDICFPDINNKDSAKSQIHEELLSEGEEVDAFITPINSYFVMQLKTGYNGTLESTSDFPALSVGKLIEVGTSIPPPTCASSYTSHNDSSSGAPILSTAANDIFTAQVLSNFSTSNMDGWKVIARKTTTPKKDSNSSMVNNSEPKVRVTSRGIKGLYLPGMCQMIIHNSTNTAKGNIWLFWHSSLTKPVVISSSNQVKVGHVLVTGIHAACLTVDRRQLWGELQDISEMNLPWMIIGDFNVALSCDEKASGRRPLRISIQEFRDCMESCNLIQATRTRIKFSWCNNRDGKKRILCDLDKAFYNTKCLDNFEGWCYKVGVRGTSDHGALFGFVVNTKKPVNAPFRYQSVWSSHPYFLKLIKDSWNVEIAGNPAFSFLAKLKRLKQILKKWNWEVFGDLRITFKKTEDEVLAVSLLSDNDPENIELLNNLVTARGKHEVASQQYNELLRAKSRVKWVQIGDVLVEHYKKKFQAQELLISEEILDVIPKILTEEDKLFLDATPSAMEIKEAVYGMDANSAPGHDGFPDSFYKYA
ncbi:uncharacterized protein LOC113359404 [Papaver somniferum]|uniref:uncharacterized protein LOC113359404 n=1 Tax=Papaver somniferum TaxID=3469 RepID=UPI000E6FC725|nr:uncharacterized protein LOC113359404 [Papaver somniferum]